jgi:hypothetical protein
LAIHAQEVRPQITEDQALAVIDRPRVREVEWLGQGDRKRVEAFG